jgi:cytoskeleton protein RodZ
MTNFGASFKKARESKGISLDQIAKTTRISTRFLAAIEDEDFKVLPGGVFNRGFVRTFAESVGLDPDQAVSDYERLVTVREPNEILTSAKPGPTTGPTKTERNLYPIAIGVLVIAVAIFYLFTRESGRVAETPTVPPVTATPAPQSAQPVTPPPTTADATPTPTEPAPAVSEQQPQPAPAPPPQAQALTLDIEAREKTWVKITADGNTVLPGEVLEPGMTRKFTAESSIGISIGNAAGLTLKINDMPLKPLGKSGQVRSVTITPANLKDFIG